MSECPIEESILRLRVDELNLIISSSTLLSKFGSLGSAKFGIHLW